MARELLNYTITVDSNQAKAELRDVDRALGQVGQQATQTGAAIDKATKTAGPGMAELHQRTLEYSKGLKGNEEQIAKLAQTTRQQTSVMDSSLAALGRRIAAVFAVERILSFGTQVVNTAGHISDLSAKTGLSTNAIQKFGYAASLSGSSIDAVANAISAMSKNLVSGGGAVEALNKLGLSQKALMAMEPEQAFLQITSAIKGMKNPMEQADMAMRIFGKGGKEILPAIKDGFAEAGEEAERLGVVMSTQTVKDLDDLGDAWTKTYAAMQGSAAGVLATVVRIGSAMAALVAQAPSWAQRWTQALKNVGGFGMPSMTGTFIDAAGKELNWFNWLTGKTPTPTDGADVRSGWGGTGGASGPGGLEDLLALTKEFDQANRALVDGQARVTQVKRADVKATEDQTAATLAYLQAQRQVIGVNRDLLSQQQLMFNQKGVLGTNPGYGVVPGVPYGTPQLGMPGSLPPGTDPESQRNFTQFGVYGRNPGYGTIPAGTSGTGFWSGRGGQAVGIGMGVAGSAAMGAMTGGDPYAAMIGSTASAVGGAMLAGSISSTVALGAATMGIGAAAVGVYLLVKHFASVSKEVKQARVEVDAFQAELWKTMTAQQITEAGGEKWAATVIVVRDAYERMGYSAAQAESEVGKLLDTRRPDEAREAMARINEVMSTYRAILAGVNEHMGDLLGQAQALGQRLPQALLDSLNAAVKLGDMTEENARLIASLTQSAEVDWKKFDEAAARYGIAKDALGDAYQQQRITATAQQMVDDMEILLKGGATMGTVLYGMREEISTVVTEAMKFGSELPANMKPWIDELLRAGLLVDAQGEALTDITKLKFGETMQSTFQRVADSIQELIDLLKGPLTGALDTVGAKVVRPRVEVEVTGEDGTAPIWDNTRNGYAHGGVVYAAHGWVPRGTDTVPAMLTPGEGVLSRRGMAALGALNAGIGGGRGVTVNVNLAGATLLEDSSTTARRITEVVSRELVRELSRERKFAAVLQ